MNIGKIISVEFDKFRVKLFHTTKTSTVCIEGKIYYFGNIGSFLKVENSIGDTIICEVVSVIDNSSDSKPYTNFNLDSSRELIIKPVGTLKKDRKFTMGVGIFPSIYSDVFIVTEKDIQDILETKDDTNKSDNKIHNEINIGTSKSLINYSVKININKLFNIHTAVLGNSGSGKSNTISHILQQILRKKDNSGIGIKVDLKGLTRTSKNSHFVNKLDTVALFQIPHHGSDNNWDNSILNFIYRTILSVISAGNVKSYDHPGQSVKDAFTFENIIYCNRNTNVDIDFIFHPNFLRHKKLRRIFQEDCIKNIIFSLISEKQLDLEKNNQNLLDLTSGFVEENINIIISVLNNYVHPVTNLLDFKEIFYKYKAIIELKDKDFFEKIKSICEADKYGFFGK